MEGLRLECNVCGYVGDARNSHDCSEVMQKRIAELERENRHLSDMLKQAEKEGCE